MVAKPRPLNRWLILSKARFEKGCSAWVDLGEHRRGKFVEMDDLKSLLSELLQFRNERDWEQFHDSKNLAAAVSIEAAELNELFLWKSEAEIASIDPERIGEEVADVLAYLLLLAHRHGLDVPTILRDKIAKNAVKYPIEKARGVATKYNDL